MGMPFWIELLIIVAVSFILYFSASFFYNIDYVSYIIGLVIMYIVIKVSEHAKGSWGK